MRKILFGGYVKCVNRRKEKQENSVCTSTV